MAIEATALSTPNATDEAVDRWALGRGLLQVPAAHDWLTEHAAEPLCDVRFVVTATSTGSGTAAGAGGRGIYLRDPQHTRAGDVICSAFIKPALHEDAPNTARVALDCTLSLASSAPWLSCASTLVVTHGGKGFDVKVACASLPEGVHFAEVRTAPLSTAVAPSAARPFHRRSRPGRVSGHPWGTAPRLPPRLPVHELRLCHSS